MYPFKFRPILKTVLWGGEKIIPYKQIESDQKQVGESWELSGVKGNESVVANGELAGTTLPELLAREKERLLGKANYERFGNEFPLLIKFIDARQDLSIQVHPNDQLAWERHHSKGKTEMWYVVDADKGAHLRSGFAKQVTPAEYEASVADNTITDILKDYEVHPGDLFFLPAGRVHSIGAGSFIAEIQQTSDITYRIYDFNRKGADGKPRELHTELAKGAIDYTVLPDYRTHYKAEKNELTELISCPLLHHLALRAGRGEDLRFRIARLVRGLHLRRGPGHGRGQRGPQAGGASGRNAAAARHDPLAARQAGRETQVPDQLDCIKTGRIFGKVSEKGYL